MTLANENNKYFHFKKAEIAYKPSTEVRQGCKVFDKSTKANGPKPATPSVGKREAYPAPSVRSAAKPATPAPTYLII